jgi:hypothetical protein
MKNTKTVIQNLCLLTVASLAACSPQFVDPNAAGDLVELPPSKVSVRNFDQMNEAMALLTGIEVGRLPAVTQTGIDIIGNVFTKPAGGGLRSELPSSNRLGEFNASHQGAIFRLASNYCNLMVDSYRAAVNPKPFVDGMAFPANYENFEGRIPAIVTGYYNQFWGACSVKPELGSVIKEFNGDPMDPMFKGLVRDIHDQVGGTDQTAVANYLKLTCSVMLSTSCVSMF